MVSKKAPKLEVKSQKLLNLDKKVVIVDDGGINVLAFSMYEII